MELPELELLVNELETRVDRLRGLYEQYFMGIERLEPLVPRKDVERRFHLLRKEQIRNTALRFKLQNISQKYSTYQTYWMRVARKIEEGTYRRDVLKAAARFGADAIDPKDAQAAHLRREELAALAEKAGAKERKEEAPNEKAAKLPVYELEDLGELDDLESYEAIELDVDESAIAAVSAAEAISDAEAEAEREVLASLARRAPSSPKPIATMALTDPFGDEDPFPQPPPSQRIDGNRMVPSAPKLRIAPMRDSRAAASIAQAPPQRPLASQPPSSPSAPRIQLRSPTPSLTPDTERRIQAAAPAASAPPGAPSVAPRIALRAPAPATASGAPPAIRPRASTSPGADAGPPPPKVSVTPAVRPSMAGIPGAPIVRPQISVSPPRAPAPQPSRAPAPAPAPAPASKDLTDARLRELHSQYVATRKQYNEPVNAITVEGLAKQLRDSSERLKQKHGADKSVDFEVAVKDGKTILKPVVK